MVVSAKQRNRCLLFRNEIPVSPPGRLSNFKGTGSDVATRLSLGDVRAVQSETAIWASVLSGGVSGTEAKY